MLPNKNDIYVTYLPDENSKKIIDTSKKLKLEGFDVVPHLPARTMVNKSQIEKYIGNLSEASGCNKILLIGLGAVGICALAALKALRIKDVCILEKNLNRSCRTNSFSTIMNMLV